MESGVSYKNYKGPRQFDVIVVGSGIGGLTAAAMLSRRGKRVLVLEQHYTIGGFTHVFKRRDYEWDVGIHYLGEVHEPKTATASIFRYITDGKVKWADMGEVYDRFVFPDQSYDMVKGMDNWKARMLSYFPKEEKTLNRYLELCKAVTGGASMKFFAEKATPRIAAWLAGGWMRRSMLKLASQTTAQVLQELTLDQRLRAVLAGQYGDYGLSPAQSSFAIHAMVAMHYMRGAAFPVGGSAVIAEAILPVIQASGGGVLVNAPVAEFVVHKGRVQGVRMEEGGEFTAPIVISNAGFYNSMYKLMPEGHRPSGSLEDLGLEPSVGHVCLYLGFKESTAALGLEKTNLWVYPGYDHDASLANFMADPAADLPVAYISFPSAKDPSWDSRYPGRSTIDIIGLGPYDWFRKWEEGKWKKRGEEYEAYKQMWSERLLGKLYQQLPHLKGKVDHAELSTPLSTKHFANYAWGELYGLAHTPARFEQRQLKARTSVKGLYLSGQDVVTCGVAGGMFGGLLAASAVMNLNLMADAFGWCKANPG